jgi:hypothetical protein
MTKFQKVALFFLVAFSIVVSALATKVYLAQKGCANPGFDMYMNIGMTGFGALVMSFLLPLLLYGICLGAVENREKRRKLKKQYIKQGVTPPSFWKSDGVKNLGWFMLILIGLGGGITGLGYLIGRIAWALGC